MINTLHYINHPILCQPTYTMSIPSYMSITLYYGNHFIYNSHYIPTLIWNFLQYSVSNFAIFEIIFYLSSTWTLISFVCNGFLKSFLFKLQKMVNTWKKNWFLRVCVSFFGDACTQSLYTKYFTSLRLLRTLYLPGRVGLLDTPHVNHKHWSGFSNAISIISVPKITS